MEDVINIDLNDPEMKELLGSFIVETKEILEKLDVDLVEIEKNPSDMELLNQIFRSFHTIKGTSGFFGLERTAAVTHRCEDILNKLRKGEAVLTSGIMDVILIAYDKIKELLINIETNLNEDVEIDECIARLEAEFNSFNIKDESAALKTSSETALTQKSKTKRKSTKHSKKVKTASSEKQINTSKNSKTGDKTLTEEKRNACETSEIDEKVQLDEKIETVEQTNEDKKSEAGCEIENEEKIVAKEKNKKEEKNKTIEASFLKKADDTIRVDVARLDDLLNIVSELVLGRNRLAQVSLEIASLYDGTHFARELAESSKQIDLMTNELQTVVMKTRMVKIGKVFNRFPRLIRDLSKETGKEVNLIINGEDTELDKTIVEEINDPLVHLVRNSVDHGIENAEERKKVNKPEAGTVTLSASQEGNQIIIKIEDDGKGLDENLILEKAVSKGLIAKEKAKELTRQDIFNLIFLPGFSTAEKITNVSGRGVGMDVVKTNVSKLRGIINIESTKGKGTVIIIKLPLTLAIITGMIVAVGNEKLVIPLNSVIEVVRIHVESIKTINNHEVIKIRDRIIPIVNIDRALYRQGENDEMKIWQYVVIVGVAEKEFGIKVDKLIEQKEIVIKPLGNLFENTKGIAGSTIMGDGTVVMILDLAELVHKLKG